MAAAKAKDFDLRARCEFYAQKYKYKADELERGLESYAVHLFAQQEGFDAVLDGEPTTEADLAEYICRGNDLQVDGVLEDEAGKRLLLIQAAWRSKDLEEQKVESFFDVPNRILSDDYVDTGGDQIQDLLASFAEKVADGYEVILRFVTNLPVGGRAKLQAATEAKSSDYETAGKPFSCELYGVAELAKCDEELVSAIGGGLVEAVTLNFQSGNFMEVGLPHRTLIAAIKANELVALYQRSGVGNSLFNLNIRLPLASRKVNPKIVETASSSAEAGNFFYYNNGVSAVCSEFVVKGNAVEAKRLQVINGAQTVSALVRALRKAPNPDVYVLFRLTETTENYGGPFTENVIRYNNTQNPVKVSDFFSNDPIQIWLHRNFSKISGRGPIPTMYYINKQGQKPKGATGKGIKIDALAGVRHAFLYGPIPSYKEPAQFFDREERYWEAFGVDDKAVDFWPDEELFKCGAALAINDAVQVIGRKLKADPKTKDGSEAKYLYRLSRYVTALVGVGLEAIRDGSFNDYATLTASKKTFDQYVNPTMSKARSVLRQEWSLRTGGKEGVQPEYNLARHEETWIRLKGLLRDEILADLVE